jgi:GNAT superfamily N-acetyltransferase
MLCALSCAEGFGMLQTLADEWQSGANRFDRPGECYLGYRVGGDLRAVGGLNQDGYEGGAGLGRLRHVYVHPDHRRAGLGSGLLNVLILSARRHFPALRLRTDNPAAAHFYEAHGFVRVDERFATHRLQL